MFDAILQFTRTKINSLNDVFQTRSLVGVFRKDASLLQKYAEQLTNCCSRLLMAQVLIYARTSQCRHQDAIPQLLVQSVLTTTFPRCKFHNISCGHPTHFLHTSPSLYSLHSDDASFRQYVQTSENLYATQLLCTDALKHADRAL